MASHAATSMTRRLPASSSLASAIPSISSRPTPFARGLATTISSRCYSSSAAGTSGGASAASCNSSSSSSSTRSSNCSTSSTFTGGTSGVEPHLLTLRPSVSGASALRASTSIARMHGGTQGGAPLASQLRSFAAAAASKIPVHFVDREEDAINAQLCSKDIILRGRIASGSISTR